MLKTLAKVLAILVKRPATAGQWSLRILAVLILISVAMAVAMVQNARERQSTAACSRLVSKQVGVVTGEFKSFFGQVVVHLGIIRHLGEQGVLDASRPEELTRALAPFVETLPQVDSLVVATSDGLDLLLQRSASGRAEAVTIDAPLDREAAWFQKATETVQDGEVYWADPSLLNPREGKRGIAASIAWRGPTSPTLHCVVAFTIRVEEIRRFLDEVGIGAHGRILISGRDRATRISRNMDDLVEFLRPEETLLTSLEADVMRAADPDGASEPGAGRPVGAFTRNGQRWWAAMRVLHFSDRTVRVALGVPEKDLQAKFYREAGILTYIVLGILAVGVLVVILLAILYSDRAGGEDAGPSYASSSDEELRALIAEGEHARLEFKSTLRWNLKSDRPGKEISLAWLKTVTAFMNSDGGTLLIGVGDDGGLLGLEADRFKNDDKFLLHFNNLIKQHVGLQHVSRIAFAIRGLDEKKILVVDCRRSDVPVFLRDGDDESFFVRVGPGSRKLPVSKALEYIASSNRTAQDAPSVDR